MQCNNDVINGICMVQFSLDSLLRKWLQQQTNSTWLTAVACVCSAGSSMRGQTCASVRHKNRIYKFHFVTEVVQATAST